MLNNINNELKKQNERFTAPEIEIVDFDTDDVIVTSFEGAQYEKDKVQTKKISYWG